MIDVPAGALAYGFVNVPIGSHTSRTMMLPELRALLEACPSHAGLETYRAAVVDANVLGKGTLTTRRGSFRQLRELYALDPNVLVFRALRDLWDSDGSAQPLLAILSAAARDPILRATATVVLDAALGDAISPEAFDAAVQRAFPGRYLDSVRKVISRNVLGSWRQSGHVTPAPRRQRAAATSRPTAVAYALFLGYLCGLRGEEIFKTLWCRLLDAPVYVVREQAAVASRHGWIEYRYGGGVTDVGFSHLAREERAGSAR